jgi:hypothetical protein
VVAEPASNKNHDEISGSQAANMKMSALLHRRKKWRKIQRYIEGSGTIDNEENGGKRNPGTCELC